MKRTFCLTGIVCLLFCTSAVAQSARSEREKAWRMEREKQRAEARALENQQDSLAYAAAIKALKEGNWVLEANNVNFSNGITRFVSSNTNYIAFEDGNATIQTAFNNFTYSPNGLGGVTLQGNVSGGHMTVDKDGNLYCSFNVMGAALSATIHVTLTGGTNQASATVNPNFSWGAITFDGYLVPYGQAVVFQGTPQW